MSKNILVTGATGFIGRHFCNKALKSGYQIIALTRDVDNARQRLPGIEHLYSDVNQLPSDIDINIVLNLAGEPLVSGRWNKRLKDLFYQSRVGTTQALFEYFQDRQAPELLINGSAIGYYGPQTDQKLDESATHIDSFSYQLCAAWEHAASQFQSLGSRVCYLRTGIVLGQNEGALGRMLLPFKLGLGGPIGSGQQWMSWIHIDDLVDLIFHCMACDELSGAINGVAPNPERNGNFSKALGKALNRPAFLPMPGLMAKIMFGEMANELLLTGQQVVPRKALETGFEFSYPSLNVALENLIER